MTTEGILLERKGHIAVVTLNRPSRLNAFNSLMFTELQRVTAELKSRLPRVIIITGAGDKAFSAGFDVNPDNPLLMELYDAMGKKDRPAIVRGMKFVIDTVGNFTSLPVPVIAAINGLAYGGGAELSIRSDMRVMNKKAVICMSEVTLGLMPDWGGGATLAHLIGPARAADLILSARKVPADEALQLGLVNRVSDNQCLEEAMALAEMISKNGPRAIRHSLSVIRQSRDLSLAKTLDLELEEAVTLVESGESVHGVTAFLEKREADFPDIE